LQNSFRRFILIPDIMATKRMRQFGGNIGMHDDVLVTGTKRSTERRLGPRLQNKNNGSCQAPSDVAINNWR